MVIDQKIGFKLRLLLLFVKPHNLAFFFVFLTFSWNGKASVSLFETIFEEDEEEQIDIHDVKVAALGKI